MIENTALVLGPSNIAADAYIGHFSIVGHPLRIPPDQYDPVINVDGPWEVPRGADVEARAVVSPYCHIDDGASIGAAAWVGSRCRVGHDTTVGTRAQLYYGSQVYDRVTIAEDSVVAGFVCNDAIIGQRSHVFGSLVHKLVDAPKSAADPRPFASEPPPVLEDDVVVGMGALIVGGIRVGKGAYVAAGAVLTTDAEPHTLYVGNPAREVGPAPSPFTFTR